jgi:hypothetical protein
MSVLEIKTIKGQIEINSIISISKKAKNRHSAGFSEKKSCKKTSFLNNGANVSSLKRSIPYIVYPVEAHTLDSRFAYEENSLILYKANTTKTWRMACSVGALFEVF